MPHEVILQWLSRIPEALSDLLNLLAAGIDLPGVRRLLGMLLTLPALPMLVTLAGLLLLRRLPGAGRLMAWGGLLGIWFSTSGIGAGWLAGQLEARVSPGLTAEVLAAAMDSPQAPQAIVILGGGAAEHPSETPATTYVRRLTLERLAHGAWVARVTGLPVLVSGGTPKRVAASEAALMKHTLETGFRTPVRWIEELSRDTGENALYSAQILRAAGVERIILVTQAYHMPRALASFQRTGLAVLPAPHGFAAPTQQPTASDFIPNGNAAALASRASHELLGQLWYRLRGR